MNIGIIVNGSRDPEGNALFKIINLLKDYKVTPIVDGRRLPESLYKKIKEAQIDIHDVHLNCEVVITLGGDGTVLDAAQNVAKYGIPILPINIGHLGYLTTGDIQDADKIIYRLLNNLYITETRMMLDARIFDMYIDNKIKTALNEVVITKSDYTVNTIRIGLYEVIPSGGRCVEDLLVNEYVADGLIIATPTGSTAYSLSAGGPILKPDSDMFVITPLNSHNLNNRPFVVPAATNLRIKIEPSIGKTHAVIDGVPFYDFSNSKLMDIKKSEHHTNLIRTNGKSCYEVLKNKMM